MRLIDADVFREDWFNNGENEYIYDTNSVLDSIDEQPTVDFGVDLDRLKELAEADKEDRCIILPCKKGDTINIFGYSKDKGHYVVSDKVTSITTNGNGYTIKTKEKFHPIKEKDGFVIAPISEYFYKCADFYIGAKEEAEKILEKINDKI